jgi:hypothetical protein
VLKHCKSKAHCVYIYIYIYIYTHDVIYDISRLRVKSLYTPIISL